jgi:hypothetical protein
MRRESPGIEAQVELGRESRRRVRRRDAACRALSFFLPGTHSYFSERPLSGFALLFAFFFSIAAAVIGWLFFQIRPLAPRPLWNPLTIAAAAAALACWAAANFSAWRHSHGA